MATSDNRDYHRYTFRMKRGGKWGVWDAHAKKYIGRPYICEEDARSAAQSIDKRHVERTGDGPEGLKDLLRLW